ncbi:hypothetical protein RYX36_028774 [Vicia faba]
MVIVPRNLMLTTATTVNSFNKSNDSLIILSRNCCFVKKTRLSISSNMWRNVGKQACKGLFRTSVRRPSFAFDAKGYYSSIAEAVSSNDVVEDRGFDDLGFQFDGKGYSSFAEAVSSIEARWSAVMETV